MFFLRYSFWGLLLGQSAAAAGTCPESLDAFMRRLSDPNETWVHGSPAFVEAELHSLLKPTHELSRVGNSKLPVAVAGENELNQALAATQDRGLWFLFSPVGPDQRTASGHLMTFINGQLFSRNMDQDPEGAIQVASRWADATDLSWLPIRYRGKLLLAQYIELSPKATAAAHQVYRQRAELALTQSFRPYVYLPLTRQKHYQGENCVIFSFSPFHQRGEDLTPGLVAFDHEVPFWTISEIPNRQIYLNSRIPRYRGSMLVGSPEDLEKLSTPGHFYDDGALSFMLAEPLRKIER